MFWIFPGFGLFLAIKKTRRGWQVSLRVFLG